METILRSPNWRRPNTYWCLLFVLLTASGLQGCSEAVEDDRTKPNTGQYGNGANAARPTREEILLIKRMEHASVEEIKAFMREVVDEEMPSDFVTPDYIVQAGDAQAASAAIGEHFPEFYMKGGGSLMEAIAKAPVRYKQLILESKALRKYYGKEAPRREGSQEGRMEGN